MSALILHPTDISQWHALVNEAQAETRIILPVETESYLVFLLMRFTQAQSLMESVMAFDVLSAMQMMRRKKIALLKDVGDKSLLYCGLFPGLALRRGVNRQYYSDIGQAAYLTVSELESPDASLYAELSCQFESLCQILNTMKV